MLMIGRIVTRYPSLLDRAHSGMGQLGVFFQGSRSEPDGYGGRLWEIPKWQRHSLTPVLLGSQMSTPQYVMYLTLDYNNTLIIPAVTIWCYIFYMWTPEIDRYSPPCPNSMKLLGSILSQFSRPDNGWRANKMSPNGDYITLFLAFLDWWIKILIGDSQQEL